jgi:tetratricopeptide (TPR) repeat protein
VLPFEVHSSDSSLTFLRDGMPDLIAAALAGTPQLLVADQHEVSSALRERAVAAGVTQPRIAAALLRRLGAARVVTGSVVGASRRLIINLRSFDSTGSGDFPVEVAGSIDSIAGLVDRLASALLAGTVARDEAHLSDLAGRSLPALRSYVRGRSLYRQGRLDSAVAAFREALHTDSTFALAALGIAAAGGWTVTSLSLRETRDFRIGWKLRLGLSSNDRALFDAYVGPRDPSEQTDLGQLAAWERVYVLVPERAEVAYEYGDRLFHVGEYLGVVRPQQQAAQAFAYAVSRDSGLVSPLAHLVEITARGEDKERARALLRVYETGDTTADAAAYLRWQIAVRTGDSVALRALRGRIPDFSSYSLRRLISLSQIDAMGVGDAERAMTALLIRQATPGDRGIILHRAHAFALNRGRVAESEMYLRELRSLGTSDASWAVRYGDAVQHQVFDALFSVGDSTTARNAASELLPSADANRSRHRFPFTTSADACTLELWRLSRGVSRHSAETLARLRRAEAQSDSAHYYGWNPRVCIAMIEAAEAVVVSRPNAEGFLARLDSIMMTGPHQFGASVGNLLLARLYASRGDREKALRALRRRWRDVDDGPLYVADGFALEFRLLEEAGDTSASAAVRERYRALRGGDAVNVPLWPSLAKR